ncbi:hypothetical protein WJX75_004182 [Coccomyxa subellipsoidea]|uniref:Uncharacterized protein n=1 Tax=Coccomyxa subellipsoidea TaxID=248742 RepID=A0ABR2YBF8_9CHLO
MESTGGSLEPEKSHVLDFLEFVQQRASQLFAGYLGDSPGYSDSDVEQLKLLPEIIRIRNKELRWLRKNIIRLREKADAMGIDFEGDDDEEISQFWARASAFHSINKRCKHLMAVEKNGGKPSNLATKSSEESRKVK